MSDISQREQQEEYLQLTRKLYCQRLHGTCDQSYYAKLARSEELFNALSQRARNAVYDQLVSEFMIQGYPTSKNNGGLSCNVAMLFSPPAPEKYRKEANSRRLLWRILAIATIGLVYIPAVCIGRWYVYDYFGKIAISAFAVIAVVYAFYCCQQSTRH